MLVLHWSERCSPRISSSCNSRTLTACSVSFELGLRYRQLRPLMTGVVNGLSDLRSVPSGVSHAQRLHRESRALHSTRLVEAVAGQVARLICSSKAMFLPDSTDGFRPLGRTRTKGGSRLVFASTMHARLCTSTCHMVRKLH